MLAMLAFGSLLPFVSLACDIVISGGPTYSVLSIRQCSGLDILINNAGWMHSEDHF